MTDEKKSAAATKEDIELLMDSLAKQYDAMERWKDDLLKTTSDRFDFAVETIRREVPPAKSDEIASLRDRVRRIEERLGLWP
jgi:hypothetical protein